MTKDKQDETPPEPEQQPEQEQQNTDPDAHARETLGEDRDQ